jgi:SAM-dependent methyltransferase
MNRKILKAHLKTPQSRLEIIEEFCSGKVVLDIGCVQHDIENADLEGWLHNQVAKVAKEVLGVDYLEAPIKELATRGYNVIQGDVNRSLPLDKLFDVIVVGNLIEHLSNFEGLMNNLKRLLKHDGVVLISTANPFYSEQYFFSAFKNDIIVNPEHTCWIDPVTLNQLAIRYGLETVSVRWVKERWRLSSGIIFHDNHHEFDIFSGKWVFHSKPLFFERLFAWVLINLLPYIFSVAKYDRIKEKYLNNTGRYFYFSIKGKLFGAYWFVRRLLIPSSDINRYELYMSVLKKYNQD